MTVIFEPKDFDFLSEKLGNMARTIGFRPEFHFTNGTYQYDSNLIIPTMLAGFKFIDDHTASNDVFALAINSDISMARIYKEKGTPVREQQSQEDRAKKVLQPLQEAFPQRTFVAMFYDEPTPTELYDALARNRINLGSLHKWGYGTDPDAPRIEGAHNFRQVLAFPLPNDTKPMCHELTFTEDQSSLVEVTNLTTHNGAHGQPYINGNNQILFPLPATLQRYAAPQGNGFNGGPVGPAL